MVSEGPVNGPHVIEYIIKMKRVAVKDAHFMAD